MGKNIAIAILGGIVGGLLGGLVSVTLTPPTQPQPAGAAAGTDHFYQEVFKAGLITGGDTGTYTTSTSPITAKDVCNQQTLALNYSAAAQTQQLPSSTSMFAACMGTVGNSKQVFLRNTAATTTVTIGVSDSSSSLKVIYAQATSTTGAATTTLTGGDLATLRAFRSTSSSQPWLYWILEVFR